MFPLGAVLLPGMPLRLHVFEPRYREMVRDCLAGNPEFGVVLIERGSEVGGGDVRTDVGTVARIVEAGQYGDGRWGLGTVGVRRVRITRWLHDDPYPRAEVVDWPEDGDTPDLAEREPVVSSFRRLLAVTTELGGSVPPATVDLADDPAIAVYQMTAGAPLGPADRQSILAAPAPSRQWELLGQLLIDQTELLEARMAMTDRDDGFDEGLDEL